MSNLFSQVPRARVPRSIFNRNNRYLTTFDPDYLIPFYNEEVLPGDTHDVRVNAFSRIATPIHPIMDNIKLTTFFFFVPNRLIWDNWEKFNGAQDDPADSTDYTIPIITGPSAGYGEGSIYDYMGVPTEVVNSPAINALPLRAYNLIWNEWFRDENLQDSAFTRHTDSSTGEQQYMLLKRGKKHDYFTSCLPWPQKGDAVSLPLNGQADIVWNNPPWQAQRDSDNAYVDMTFGSPTSGTNITDISGRLDNPTDNWALGYLTRMHPDSYVDLSTATGATINALREAFQLQKLFERDARGGTRYVEIIKSHFGVTSPDFRLQRPEYLGGGSSYININPIAQTSESSGTPQGNLAAMGTGFIDGHGFKKSFTEHGIVIGLICATADLTYQQGLNRMWTRSTRYDYYWPAFAHLGEQAVLNKEIYLKDNTIDTGATGTVDNDRVFGYNERWSEYRYKPSLITGKFRSNATGTLQTWHLAEDFASLPTLNNDFIQNDMPMDRVVAVPTEPKFLLDCFIVEKTARPMPTWSVPGLIDHF